MRVSTPRRTDRAMHPSTRRHVAPEQRCPWATTRSFSMPEPYARATRRGRGKWRRGEPGMANGPPRPFGITSRRRRLGTAGARRHDVRSRTAWRPVHTDRWAATPSSPRTHPAGGAGHGQAPHSASRPPRYAKAELRLVEGRSSGLRLPRGQVASSSARRAFPPRTSASRQWHSATSVADHSGASAADSHGLVLLGPHSGHPRRWRVYGRRAGLSSLRCVSGPAAPAGQVPVWTIEAS